MDLDILGRGIYTPRQAARLIGSTPQQVLRWTRGSGPTEPLWNSHYQALDDCTELSFADLIEVRVVRAFRTAGMSLQGIRFAIRYAKETFGSAYPLSTLQFKTDGKEILMQALDREDHYVSLSPKRIGQRVFSEVVKQSLRDLEYEDNHAARWRPYQEKSVVLDPNRQFGTPLIDEYGISTRVISDEFAHFKDERYLSSIYEVPVTAIRAALRFEVSLDEQFKPDHGESTL